MSDKRENTHDAKWAVTKRSDVPPWANEQSSFAAPAGYAAQIPDVLFDGNAVWQSLDERAKTRTSAENVSDVLDAVVRLMRRDARHNDKDHPQKEA